MKITIYKKSLAGILMFFAVSNLYGQGMPNVTPPSPNAAAFSKYGNIPVSQYTGVPNISIPLYEINIRDIKIPISVSYHASGIRVGDEASRIGLGWVLNAGGLISRNIVNVDDFQDLPQAFLSNSNEAPALVQGPSAGPASLTQAGVIYTYYDGAVQSTPMQADLSLYLVPQGIDPLFKPHDFEPDQFTYNFLGHSGKFVLNKGRQVILEKQEKIRIEPPVNGSGFTVTTSDGFVYKFIDFEYVIDNDNTSGYQQKTSWYLSEIISPQNESVKFNYTPLGQQHIIPGGSIHQRVTPIVLSCAGMNCRGIPSPPDRILTGKNYAGISLESIVWSQGKIKFNMANDRLDILGDQRITSVQIFKKGAIEPYEEIVFSHDYFTSPPANATGVNEFFNGQLSQAVKRLKLNGLTRRSIPAGSAQPEQHFFTYYEPNYIPGKNSYSRDHWGYFNGKGNTSLIPSYKRVTTGVPYLGDYIGIMGSERDPNPAYAQMLSLQSIVYPTKGSTTFYYSSNEYEVEPSDGSEIDEPEAYPETTSFIYNTANKGVVQSTLFDLRDEYVNKEGKTVPITIRGGFRTNMTVACNQMLGAPNIYFEVFTEGGLSMGRVSPNGARCSAPDDPECVVKNPFDCITCCQGSMFFDYTGNITLSPGKYYWKAFMESTETQLVDITASYTWMVDPKKRPQTINEPDGSIKLYRTGGGLRISKIEDYDPDSNQKVNVKKYVYGYKTDIDANGIKESHSYGRRMVKPAYSYFDVSWEESVEPITGSTATCLQCLTLVRDSGHPLANYEGNSVGYTKVIEYLGENGENGYTEYEFENQPDGLRIYNYPYGSLVDIPIKPPFSASVKNPGNGNLKRQTHFNAANQKLLLTENTYLSKYQNIMYGLSSRKIPIDPGISPQTAAFMQILLIYQSINSEFPYLSETTVTSFLPTGQEASKKRTQYFYDKQEHLQLTKSITYESNLHKTIANYNYPADYTDAQSSPAILSMKNAKFMHSLPVQTTILNEAPDGVQKIKHRDFIVYDNFGTFTFPKEKLVLESSTPLLLSQAPAYIPASAYDPLLYKKAFTLEYNTFGNIKKIQKTSDMPVGFLWGYDEKLPIAEIKNGLAEESFYTSFEEDGDLYTDASALNIARTGLRVKSVAAYTFPTAYAPVESNTLMSYWYWQNSQWNFSGVIPFQRTITTAATKLDEIRAYPKGAQMTTFTHIPIIGMSSQTDANNVTTNYEFDEMGRLKVIRDFNKRILKSYEYAYKK